MKAIEFLKNVNSADTHTVRVCKRHTVINKPNGKSESGKFWHDHNVWCDQLKQ